MKTVTIDVASIEETKRRMKAAFRGEKQDARISFVSFELLHKLLTPTRWRLLEAMTGAGEIGVRELARRVDRDVRAVHADLQALATSGVIERAEGGKYLFPFDAVKVAFELRAVA